MFISYVHSFSHNYLLQPPLEEDDDDFEWATEVEEGEVASDTAPIDEGEVADVESEETPVEDEIVESDPTTTTTTEKPPEPLAVNPARLLTPGKRYVSLHTPYLLILL